MHKSISFVFSLFFNLVTDWLILQCVLLHLPFGNWNRLQLLNWISVGKWMVYFQVNLGDYPLKKKTIVDVLCPADFISTITMICRFAANTWIDPNMTSRQKIYESCGLLRKSIFHSPLSSVIFYFIFFLSGVIPRTCIIYLKIYSIPNNLTWCRFSQDERAYKQVGTVCG